MPFSSSDASALLYAGGDIGNTLKLCQYLDLTGCRFGSFASLITGVGQLRLSCMQERRELLFFLTSPDCPLFAQPSTKEEDEGDEGESEAEVPVAVTRSDAEHLHDIGLAHEDGAQERATATYSSIQFRARP